MPRHKEYAPEEVLDKATQLFWRQGYEATSMQDLVDHLGINRFSIYDTFGSKHKLFLAAIDHYRNVYAAGLRATLEDESKGLQAIRDYFAMMESELSKAGGRVGCLVQNSTLECVLTDGDVETRIQETNLSFVRAIRAALRRAEKMGEIEESGDLTARARLLFSVGQGMLVVGKGHAHRKMLRDITKSVGALLEDW